MVLDQGYRFAEACRAVDVHENTLRNWVQQLENEVSFEQGNEWIELGGSRVELI
jgi:transposase-like protein